MEYIDGQQCLNCQKVCIPESIYRHTCILFKCFSVVDVEL